MAPAMSSRRGLNLVAMLIALAADIAAAILVLWIVMVLLDANRANDLVAFIQDAARWLASWSHDIFTMETEWLRTVLNFGLPAVVYLFVGHAVAARITRLRR
jgi:hypothetical protein